MIANKKFLINCLIISDAILFCNNKKKNKLTTLQNISSVNGYNNNASLLRIPITISDVSRK